MGNRTRQLLRFGDGALSNQYCKIEKPPQIAKASPRTSAATRSHAFALSQATTKHVQPRVYLAMLLRQR